MSTQCNPHGGNRSAAATAMPLNKMLSSCGRHVGSACPIAEQQTSAGGAAVHSRRTYGVNTITVWRCTGPQSYQPAFFFFLPRLRVRTGAAVGPRTTRKPPARRGIRFLFHDGRVPGGVIFRRCYLGGTPTALHRATPTPKRPFALHRQTTQ